MTDQLEKDKMTISNTSMLKALATTCGGGFVLLVIAGCTSAQDQHFEDSRACYDSRHYAGCMNQQQFHRDRQQLMNQERALINAQQARENLRMLREIRRKRGEY